MNRIPPRIDRLPPHSIEAEQGVLGCILLDPNENLGLAVQSLREGAETFYDLRHQTIYGTMLELSEGKQPIDLISLQQRLRDRKQIEAVGGISYLSGLINGVPSAANMRYYLSIIKEKSGCRKLIAACTGIVARLYEAEDQFEAVLAEAEETISRVRETSEEPEATMAERVADAQSEIESKMKTPGTLQGVPTGIDRLDRKTNGFKPGQFVILAARPSVGKSALAMQIAEYAAVHHGIPVGVFSLEMDSKELVVRMLCSRGHVRMSDVNSGGIETIHFNQLVHAGKELAQAPIHICDRCGLTLAELRHRARRMVYRHKVGMLIVDYLQLVRGNKNSARYDQVTEVSNEMKILAKDLAVPILALAQLNREIEKDKNRLPRLSDLRDSGAVEQDGDIILFLHPEGDEDAHGVQAVKLVVGKHRNGTKGWIDLRFNKPFTRFDQVTVERDDLPETDQQQQFYGQP